MRSKIKSLLIVLFLMLGINAIAQQTIQLHPAGSTKFEKSDMSSLRASFSFSALNAQDYTCSEGEFSVLSMAKTVIGGNEGDPQIPVINELIAVPVGATPRIEVKSYHVEDYSLSDYDIKTLMPRQPSLRKDKNPEDVPFVRNHASYQKSGFSSAPKAVVEVVGTMRGVRLGKMTIEPVSYDPSSNSVRVFNDIEVEVCFDGADAKATEDLLVKTYSPYFNAVYNQMYNSNVVNSAYDDHPDLYTTPVKMLVITTQAYANSQAFHDWVTWKKQKGIYVDVYTTAQTGATAARIKSFIKKQYVQNHPTFLVIVGDKADVPNSLNSNTTNKVTDLYYSSPDGDIFPDIFLSRMPVSSTAELTNLIHKILTYEQYTMSDPSYLNNVLLIAGSDANWNPQVGRPTINYAADNYFNTEHGFTNVYKYLNSYNGCYDNMNTGIGFANYTAHGDDTEWSGPQFTVSDANSLTNNDKYFWAMGNCCLAANWGYSGTCLAEALLRGANKGAFGYIGSCPETYWYEDYYFGVGATNTFNTTPAMSATKTGVYDVLFDDSGFNTLNAVPFFGNVAVTYAHANNYTSSISDTYYWEAYHCLGDGSVMPYLTNPAANTVNHNDVIFMGTKAFTVSADAGSYVSITKDNEILGVAVVPPAGTVEVPITPVESVGEVMVVVTRQQRQPYIQTIMAIAPEGPYIALGSYTPRSTPIGKDTDLSLTFKNIGTEATDSTTTVTLTSADANVTIINGTGTFEALAADTTVTVGGFQFRLNKGVKPGSTVFLHYTAVNGENTWEGNLAISPSHIITTAANPLWGGTATGGGEYNYGETCTLTATSEPGYYFIGWNENGEIVSKELEYSFTVDNDRTLTAVFSEGSIAGEGATETNTHLPSYSYYNYSLSQQLYTPEEVGASGKITAISFYNGGAEKTRTFDLYLVQTTKSEFTSKSDWITAAEGDKVFSGEVTLVSGDWTTITFSKPYEYDGTSNLALIVDDNTNSSTSQPYMECRVYKTGSFQALYAHSGRTNYDPLAPPTTAQNTNSARLTEKNQVLFNYISTDTVDLDLADDGTANEAAINAAAASGKTFNVKLAGRTLYKDGEWNTICLPFDVVLEDSPLEGATAKTLTDAVLAGTNVRMAFANPDGITEPVTELRAGVPYLIRWKSGDDIVEPVFNGVTVVSTTEDDRTIEKADGHVKFIGYYDALDITADDTDIYCIAEGNKLRHIAKPCTLMSCRAYFKIRESDALAKFMLDFGDGTTGIVENNREKVANDRWFTVDGKLLQQQPTRKGVYIHNGVKVVIK